mgnify:CR=1 FL=1
MYETIAIDPSSIEPIKAIWEYVIPAALTFISGNKTRSQAKSQAQKDREYQDEQNRLLEEQKQAYRDIVFTNPFADMTNAFGGLQTDFQNLNRDAKNVYGGLQTNFQNLAANTQNFYEGMENRFEDLTVDTRAADFQAQQGRQQRANILQGLRGAAGSSGIASLAQSLANQGALQAQQISANIGQQERQNQLLAAQGGSKIDQMQRAADMQLQQMSIAGAERARGLGISRENLMAQGASEQQRLQLAGADRARGLQVARENLVAQGEQQTDMARRTGEQMLQEAEMSRQATLLGMQMGQASGANQALQMSLYNQQQANNASNEMFNNMFSKIPFGNINFGNNPTNTDHKGKYTDDQGNPIMAD